MVFRTSSAFGLVRIHPYVEHISALIDVGKELAVPRKLCDIEIEVRIFNWDFELGIRKLGKNQRDRYTFVRKVYI